MCAADWARAWAPGANGGKGFDRLRGFELRVPDPHASDPLAATLGGGPPPRDARRAAAAAEAPPLPLPPLPPLGRSGAIFWIAPSWAMPHFVPFLGTERRCAEVLAHAGADSHWRTAPACTASAFLHLSGYPWKRIRPLILRLYMPPRGAALTTSAAPPTNLVSLDPRSFAAAWPAAVANVTASDAGAAALRALELDVLAPLVGLAIGTGRKLVVPTLPRIAWPDPGADSRWSRLPVGCGRARRWVWLPTALERGCSKAVDEGLLVDDGAFFVAERATGRRAANLTLAATAPAAWGLAIRAAPEAHVWRVRVDALAAAAAKAAAAAASSAAAAGEDFVERPPTDEVEHARKVCERVQRAAAAVRVSSKDARLA